MKDKHDLITQLLDRGFDVELILIELVYRLPASTQYLITQLLDCDIDSETILKELVDRRSIQEVKDFVESFKSLYEVD